MKRIRLLALGTALFMASQYGTADVNADFVSAVIAGNTEEVRRLVDARVDVDAPYYYDRATRAGYGSTGKRRTALMYAAGEGFNEIVALLIEAGADVNAREWAITHYDRLNVLMYATFGGQPITAEMLIDAGADLSARDINGNTALVHALPLYKVDGEEQNRRLEVCRLLIRAGADLDATDHSGFTVLMKAAQKGHEDFVRLFLDADLNATDGFGRTPLIMSVDKGYTGVVRVLVEAGADVNMIDRFGSTALSIAQDKGYREIAEILTAAGAR